MGSPGSSPSSRQIRASRADWPTAEGTRGVRGNRALRGFPRRAASAFRKGTVYPSAPKPRPNPDQPRKWDGCGRRRLVRRPHGSLRISPRYWAELGPGLGGAAWGVGFGGGGLGSGGAWLDCGGVGCGGVGWVGGGG